jgi:dynein heavy chain 1, cytosolic
LKCVLRSAGNLKRASKTVEGDIAEFEKGILLQSLCNTLIPKLVSQDIPLFKALLMSIFPNYSLSSIEDAVFMANLEKVTSINFKNNCKNIKF